MDITRAGPYIYLPPCRVSGSGYPGLGPKRKKQRWKVYGRHAGRQGQGEGRTRQAVRRMSKILIFAFLWNVLAESKSLPLTSLGHKLEWKLIYALAKHSGVSPIHLFCNLWLLAFIFSYWFQAHAENAQVQRQSPINHHCQAWEGSSGQFLLVDRNTRLKWAYDIPDVEGCWAIEIDQIVIRGWDSSGVCFK